MLGFRTAIFGQDLIYRYRVAGQPCGRRALSELGVKVSLHPAQAFERLFRRAPE
jgi:hypothetical protein